MIEVSEASFGGGQPVDGYGPGFFRLGEHVHQGPLALMPAGVIAWDGLPDVAPLVAHADAIDVLFIGTGADIAQLPDALIDQLTEAGVGVEVMATPPAARTYNVLLTEGRRVGIALMPV